jgi:hypothetical protein
VGELITGAPCQTCEGSGLVALSPFYGDVTPWPVMVRVAAESYRLGMPFGGSPVLAGLWKGTPCPACGGVVTVPAPSVVCFEKN